MAGPSGGDAVSHMYCVYPWSEVKASRQGGPKPRCRICGLTSDVRKYVASEPSQQPITIADGTVGMRRGE